MSVAALYDVHGNLPALEAVLAEIPDSATIVVGGDVAAGPWPAETLERLRSLGERVRWIRGNADRVLVAPEQMPENAPRAEIAWVRARLSKEQLDFLAHLPLTVSVDTERLGPVLFCHATPRDDEELLTSISPDERWLTVVRGVSERVIVCGHTHMQFDRVVGDVRIVNAGSVGMPYEEDDGAFWALFGPDVEHRRSEYDVAQTIRDVAATGWPAEWPVAPPEEATKVFERISGERWSYE